MCKRRHRTAKFLLPCYANSATLLRGGVVLTWGVGGYQNTLVPYKNETYGLDSLRFLGASATGPPPFMLASLPFMGE
eukprot:3848849-Rhodomonas_salina.1